MQDFQIFVTGVSHRRSLIEDKEIVIHRVNDIIRNTLRFENSKVLIVNMKGR